MGKLRVGEPELEGEVLKKGDEITANEPYGRPSWAVWSQTLLVRVSYAGDSISARIFRLSRAFREAFRRFDRESERS